MVTKNPDGEKSTRCPEFRSIANEFGLAAWISFPATAALSTFAAFSTLAPFVYSLAPFAFAAAMP